MTGLKAPKRSLLERGKPYLVGLGVDISARSGAVVIVVGIDQMHRPSAYIAAGVFLFALSMLAARRSE